jgi:hypothetical protein
MSVGTENQHISNLGRTETNKQEASYFSSMGISIKGPKRPSPRLYERTANKMHMLNRKVRRILQRQQINRVRNFRMQSIRGETVPVDVSESNQRVELTTVFEDSIGTVHSTTSRLRQSRGTSDPNHPSDEKAMMKGAKNMSEMKFESDPK